MTGNGHNGGVDTKLLAGVMCGCVISITILTTLGYGATHNQSISLPEVEGSGIATTIRQEIAVPAFTTYSADLQKLYEQAYLHAVGLSPGFTPRTDVKIASSVPAGRRGGATALEFTTFVPAENSKSANKNAATMTAASFAASVNAVRSIFGTAIVEATAESYTVKAPGFTVEGCSLSGCTDGISCKAVSANNMVFNCRMGGEYMEQARKGDVLLLHGFPEWSSLYMPLMRELAEAGYRSLACDQRGYSPQAAPDNSTAYDVINDMRVDAWAYATAAGFISFHLIGHDFGALVGWAMVALGEGPTRILSYTAESVPHPDAFSLALWQPGNAGTDQSQQLASQYFRAFELVDSASHAIYGNPNNTLYEGVWAAGDQTPFGVQETGFADAAAFQKVLWWYHNALAVYGRIASPPVFGSPPYTPAEAFAFTGFGLPASDGVVQARPLGTIKVDTLFICGSQDTSLKCNEPYAHTQQDYFTPPAVLTYVLVDCGHGVNYMNTTNSNGCLTEGALQVSNAAILNHIKVHTNAGLNSDVAA